VLALVGGDKRILDAYCAAVRETLAWAEKNLAETRMEVRGSERVVRTGNLVAAVFQHDTNRNQEPNAHFHAVIANVTQGPDGKWRALRNDKLWDHNTLLNSMTMARFRLSVEKLGYEVGEFGKHGNFEAVGVPKDVRDAFSSRRAEVLAAAAQMNSQGPKALDAATLMTRARKEAIEDRAALTQQWKDTAEKLGFDPAMVIARANARSAKDLGNVPGLGSSVRKVVEQGKQIAHDFAERLGIAQGDPLIPSRLGNRSPEEVAAIHGVASATDHRRGLLNADQARIIAVDAKGVSLATSIGVLHRLAPDDPMLKRLDLAYALNAHMAQGLTSDRGIAVMDSREKNLANQQTFLVTITRLRDRLTLFVDNAGKLEAAVENNPGMKRSALEPVDLLRNAAATGAEKVRDSEAERKAPELDRSISKKFDMGL